MRFTDKATMRDVEWTALLLTNEDAMEHECLLPGVPPERTIGDFVWMASNMPDRYKARVVRTELGHPIALGGWNTLSGTVWFVTTDLAKTNKVKLLKAVRECLEEARKECQILHNEVMKTNRAHVRLLEHLGAEFFGPIVGKGGEPFQQFIIHNKEE